MNLTVEFKKKLLTILPDRKPVMIYIYKFQIFKLDVFDISTDFRNVQKITHSETNEKVFRLYTTYIVSSNEIGIKYEYPNVHSV